LTNVTLNKTNKNQIIHLVESKRLTLFFLLIIWTF